MNQVGPYQIISELGRGGMATVYRALQPSVNRIVALKVLPSHVEHDTEAVRRFRREAETAANLTHEHIVKVWDASVTSPPYYIAMEFLEGGTLADRLLSGPLPMSDVLTIAAKVCAAIGHAHQHGIVHRDVKPANIMFDAAGRTVVTDFGIARASEQPQLTAPGAKFGTPNYMSPEQASGLPTDRRTDIYSTGAVLYEMATGRPPCPGDDPLAVMYRIVNEEPIRPSALNPAVSPPLEAVIMRALDKDPRRRFQTGAEMAAALSAVNHAAAVASPTLRVPGPGRARRASTRARPRRRPALFLAAAITLLAMAAGGAAYLASSEGGFPIRPRTRDATELVAPDPRQVPGDYRDAVGPSEGQGADSADIGAPVGGPAGGELSASAPAAAGDEAQATLEADRAEPETASRDSQPVELRSTVPDVTGKTKEEAQAALRQVNLTWGTTLTAHRSVGEGRIVSQEPEAGAELPPNAKVVLTVSSGPPKPSSRGTQRPTPQQPSKPPSGPSEGDEGPGPTRTDREARPP